MRLGSVASPNPTVDFTLSFGRLFSVGQFLSEVHIAIPKKSLAMRVAVLMPFVGVSGATLDGTWPFRYQPVAARVGEMELAQPLGDTRRRAFTTRHQTRRPIRRLLKDGMVAVPRLSVVVHGTEATAVTWPATPVHRTRWHRNNPVPPCV